MADSYEFLKAQKDEILARITKGIPGMLNAAIVLAQSGMIPTQGTVKRWQAALRDIEIPPQHTQNEEPRRVSRVDGAASRARLCEWLIERMENCQAIAAMKIGTDKDGWLEDAQYFKQAALFVGGGASKQEMDAS
jgi:hypothetical protein